MIALASPLSLRACDTSDEVFLAALYRSTRDDLAPLAADEAMLAQLLALQHQAQVQGTRAMFPQAEHFLIARDGVPIGRLVLDRNAARIHVVDLALLPEARGHGWGGAVLCALQQLARDSALPLTLSVSVANTGARRLYGRHGFAAYGGNSVQESLHWRASDGVSIRPACDTK